MIWWALGRILLCDEQRDSDKKIWPLRTRARLATRTHTHMPCHLVLQRTPCIHTAEPSHMYTCATCARARARRAAPCAYHARTRIQHSLYMCDRYTLVRHVCARAGSGACETNAHPDAAWGRRHPFPPCSMLVGSDFRRAEHRCEINAHFCKLECVTCANIESRGSGGTVVWTLDGGGDGRLFRSNRNRARSQA